jgi:glycine/serine hydroxymethyltransferase
MVALAIDLAEKQLRDGTASAQVISHFIKLGSSRERLEQERLTNENVLLAAKTEAMASQARVEAMYAEALNAMRTYAGHDPVDVSEDYDD